MTRHARPSIFQGRFRPTPMEFFDITTTILKLSFPSTKPTQEPPWLTMVWGGLRPRKLTKINGAPATLLHFPANRQSDGRCHHLGFVAHHPRSKTQPTLTPLDHRRRRIDVGKFLAPAGFVGKIDHLPSTFGLHGRYESCSTHWDLHFCEVWEFLEIVGFSGESGLPTATRGGAWPVSRQCYF